MTYELCTLVLWFCEVEKMGKNLIISAKKNDTVVEFALYFFSEDEFFLCTTPAHYIIIHNRDMSFWQIMAWIHILRLVIDHIFWNGD